MPRVLVDSRTLEAVRDKLGRLHDQLLGMPTIIAGYDGILGGRTLEVELEHFSSRRHHETIEIAGQISDLMRRLTGAAAAYRQIEDRLASEHRATGPRSRGSGTTTIEGDGTVTTVIRTGPSRGRGTTTIS